MSARDEIRQNAENHIQQAIDDFSVTDQASIDAIKQAVFRAVGGTEAAVVFEAERRMEPERARELRRVFFGELEK